MKLFSKNDQTSGGADWLIVGLATRARKYEMTRHNAGFLMLDAIAEHFNIEVRRVRIQGPLRQGHHCGTERRTFKALHLYGLERTVRNGSDELFPHSAGAHADCIRRHFALTLGACASA